MTRIDQGRPWRHTAQPVGIRARPCGLREPRCPGNPQVSDLDRIVAALQAAPSVAVLAHVHPEADAIGATLGASLALHEAGKVTAAYNADPLPPGLSCLPGAAHILHEVPIGRRYACYLVLDTSDLARTGGLLDGRPTDAVLLNVDHHAGNTRFGDVNWVEPEASSVLRPASST